MKKIIILIVILIVLILLAAFFVFYRNYERAVETNNDITNVDINVDNTDKQNLEAEQVDNTDEKPILFFHNGTLVGYIQNNKLNKSEDVLLKDIFDNESYTIYSDDYKKERVNKIKLRLDPGEFSFTYGGDGFDQFEDGLDNHLSKYGTWDDKNYFYVFDIPNKLDDELNNTYTRCFGSSVSSVDIGFGEDPYMYKLAYNADFDLNFVSESSIFELPSDVKELVQRRLITNDVNKDTPYTITQYFKVDLNNDGLEDEIFSIVSNDSYKAYGGDYGDDIDKASALLKENGGFSLIITKINNHLDILEKCFVSKSEASNREYNMIGSTENFDIDVVDLDNDGIYEILYLVSGYEYSKSELAKYNNGKYYKLNDDTLEYSIGIDNEASGYYSINLYLMQSTGTLLIDNGWGSHYHGSYETDGNFINCTIETIYDEPSGVGESKITSGSLVLEMIDDGAVRVKEVTPWVPENKQLKEDVSCLKVGMELIK